MEHEVLLLLAFVALEPLPVIGCPQRRRNKSLRLSTREQRRAMSAWQHASLDADGTNLIEGTTIGTDAILGDLLAERTLDQVLVIRCQLLLGVGLVGGKFGSELVLDLLDQRIA